MRKLVENGFCLTDKPNDMRHPFIQLVIFLAVLSFAGCNDGLREEVVSTYDNGQPAKAYYYNKENQVVFEKDFYDTGALMMEGPMLNNQREGEWKAYFPDGKLQSTGVFVGGVSTGKKLIYHENGQLWMDGWYSNDRKCGEWIFYDELGYEIERIDYGPCD